MSDRTFKVDHHGMSTDHVLVRDELHKAAYRANKSFELVASTELAETRGELCQLRRERELDRKRLHELRRTIGKLERRKHPPQGDGEMVEVRQSELLALRHQSTERARLAREREETERALREWCRARTEFVEHDPALLDIVRRNMGILWRDPDAKEQGE